MESFYTAENLILYLLALFLILSGVSLAVLLREGKWPVPVTPILWLWVLATASFPLSYTCPYPGAKLLLRYTSLLTFVLGFLLLLGCVLIHYRKEGNLNLFPLTHKEADRWVSHSLRGSFLVSDPQGRIIGGNLRKLPRLPGYAEPGLTLGEYFATLTTWISDPEDSRLLMQNAPGSQKKGCPKSFINSKGSMTIEDHYFQWSIKPLGKDTLQGYIFSVQDLSREYKLYRQKEEQQRLMTSRLERLEYQSMQKALNDQNVRSIETVKESTEILKKGLADLLPTLENLKKEKEIREPGNWKEALEQSKETMNRLRKTIHQMDQHWRENL